MATASKDLVKHRGKGPARDLRKWQPKLGRREVSPGSGIFRDETEEEAWVRCRQEVRHYIGTMLYTEEVVCQLMQPEISQPTLRKLFRRELDLGFYEQMAKVGGTAYWMATSGRHPDMTKFVLRARAGWRDQDPVQIVNAIQFQKVDGDDW